MTKDPLKIKAQRRRHYLKYRDDQIEKATLWAKSNPERRREARRKLRARLKAAIFEKLGGSCRHCGFSDPLALQIDHVDGGGKAERKLFSNGSSTTYLQHILKGPDGKYQLLCANCNIIKYWKNPSYEIHRTSHLAQTAETAAAA